MTSGVRQFDWHARSFQMNETKRTITRRAFFSASGFAVARLGIIGCSSQQNTVRYSAGSGKSQQITGTSTVSIAKNDDRREGTYKSLKPLKAAVARAIGNKQVIIKVNAGFPRENNRIYSTYPGQIEGILQFLREFYDGEIWVAEGVGSSKTNNMMDGYKLFGYIPIAREFQGVKFIDANTQPLERKWIHQWKQHPVPIDIIKMYFDPHNYVISAERLKTHNCVVGTYSLKNIVMGSPIGNYKDRKSQKSRMHGGEGREPSTGQELSYNMFRLALEGIYPDLAVVDGITGIEGNGPWNGTPVDHNISLASTDFVACDHVCTEVMGIDPFYMKYIEWCGEAGLGNWNMQNIRITGSSITENRISYKMNQNYDKQIAWIHRNFDR